MLKEPAQLMISHKRESDSASLLDYTKEDQPKETSFLIEVIRSECDANFRLGMCDDDDDDINFFKYFQQFKLENWADYLKKGT